MSVASGLEVIDRREIRERIAASAARVVERYRVDQVDGTETDRVGKRVPRSAGAASMVGRSVFMMSTR